MHERFNAVQIVEFDSWEGRGECGQCSSLKCAHAFQCVRLQNNHTSVKLSNFLQHFTKKNLILGVFVLNVKII